MSKSNYEIYAEKKQKATLSSTCTLEQAISLLKSKKSIAVILIMRHHVKW